MRTTLKDVAKEAGVNFTLVSKLINRTPGVYIRPETRRRIEDAIHKLDYHTISSARTLRTGHSNMLGLVVGNLTNEYFAHYADAAIQEAEKLGFHLLISVCRGLDPEPAIRDLYANQVNGIVCCDSFKIRPTVGCPVLSERPFDPVRMIEAVNRAADFIREKGCTSAVGLYAVEQWAQIFGDSSLSRTLRCRFEAIQMGGEERLQQLRAICRERPDAVISSGWKTARAFCELLRSECPDYRPRVVVWANCRGPYLADEHIAAVLYTSTRQAIAEVFASLAATIPGGNAVERPVNNCSFLTRGDERFQNLLSEKFALT